MGMLTLTQKLTLNKPYIGQDLLPKTTQTQQRYSYQPTQTGITTFIPMKVLFPDLHVITHFKADTITYDEPTIPLELQIEPRTEKCDIRILCIHHKTTPINPIGYIGRIHNIGTSLHIPNIFTTTAPPTPTNTPLNQSKRWSQLTYPPSSPLTQPNNIPPITNHDICLPPKYPPQFCYYTDGSFIPPKALTDKHWRREKARYDIYNAFKNLEIAERLLGLQNIIRAEMMAIYHTLCLLTTT
jgi:hypothetical protein